MGQHVDRDQQTRELIQRAGLVFIVALPAGTAVVTELPDEALADLALHWSGASVDEAKLVGWRTASMGSCLSLNSCIYVMGAVRPTVVGVYDSTEKANRTIMKMYGHLSGADCVMSSPDGVEHVPGRRLGAVSELAG